MSTQAFGTRLKKTIEDRGQTVSLIAQKMNLTPQAIHKWITGNEISLPNLRSLATILEVNWIWLRYGDDAVYELETPGIKPDSVVSAFRRKWIGELVGSEMRHRKLMKSLGVGMCSINLLTGHRKYSDYFCKMVGMPLNETPDGSMFLELMTPEDAASAGEAVNRAVETDARQYMMFHLKSNPDKIIEGTGKVCHDENSGAPELLILIKPFHSAGVTLQKYFESIET